MHYARLLRREPLDLDLRDLDLRREPLDLDLRDLDLCRKPLDLDLRDLDLRREPLDLDPRDLDLRDRPPAVAAARFKYTSKSDGRFSTTTYSKGFIKNVYWSPSWAMCCTWPMAIAPLPKS